jgi:DegV family protein with EDD domain
MKNIKIVTDSNSGILQEEAKKLGIFVIPMPFTINDEEYLEEISISQEQFYDFLKNDVDVRTSQPSPGYLEELFTDLLKENDEVIYIPMSSGLSSTCDNATRLAEDFGGKVLVVNNTRISVTQKESVYEAIKMVELGKSALEIKDYLESTKSNNSIYIMVDVLKYLKKGGRISPAAATLGSLLNVKPILTSKGDKFEKFSMALSVGQGKKKMLQKVKSEMETEFKEAYDNGTLTISVAHTKNYQEALKFKDEIMKEFPKVEFRFVDALSLSVSCHIGPGALAIALTVDNYLD